MSAKPKELGFGANAARNVLSWFVPALVALIVVPITVRGLGPDAYGLLALVGALTGYLHLMELGLGSAVVRYLSYYRALNEGRPMLGILRFALTWFGGAGVIGCVILVAGAEWFAGSLLDVPADLLPTAVVVIRITGFGFLMGMFTSVGAVIPMTFLRYDISAWATIVFGTLGSVGPAVLVTLGYGLVALSLFSLATSLLAIVFYTIVTVRLFKPIDLSAGPSWRSIRRKTFRFAGLAALNSIHSTVASQTSRVIVGVASGVAAAAYYQVPWMLANRVNTMLGRAAYVIFPTASGMKARHDEEGISRLYLRTSRLFFSVNGSASMAMCALAYPLLRYWVNADYATEGSVALVIFTLTQAVNATTMAASQLNMSAARPGVNLTFAISNSAVSLATVYPLTVRWGVTGAALSGLLGAANVPAFFWYVHKHITHMSSRRVWRECYRPTVLANVPIGVAVYLLLTPRVSTLLEALLAFALASLLGMVGSGLLGAIKREDLRSSWEVAKGLWPRRKPPAGTAEPSADDAA